MTLDARRVPARPDLAAAHLEGQVSATAYAKGRRLQVVASFADLRRRPSDASPLETQILRGETLIAYEEKDGWAWVQLDKDRYVGYVALSTLTEVVMKPTHRIRSRHTFIYADPDIKGIATDALPFGAEITVVGATKDFYELSTGGYLFANHVAPSNRSMSDFVAIAETFLHTPYLWGGKTDLGIDCSGLVQTSLQAIGVNAPRDADMMETELGKNILKDTAMLNLQRGDLVFWPGHVGIMQSPTQLLHANASSMSVASELLSVVRERCRLLEHKEVRSIRRL